MLELVTQIVSAFVRKNAVGTAELPGLIASVSQALTGLGQEPASATSLTPAVPIRRSVGAATITCLNCGKEAQMLKRHLMTAHRMGVDEYRTRWGLPSDYPMVARNYSARRSELAKSLGLGRRRGAPTPIEETPSPVPPPMFTDDDVAPKRRGRPRRSTA
jgi:MucR family transcriptional regulator, transcriptional regulator of exopolysaccharide biosynthesis